MHPTEFEIKYTNVMLTRQATKKNVVIAGPPRVQFCPFDDVVDELGRFVHLARVRNDCPVLRGCRPIYDGLC